MGPKAFFSNAVDWILIAIAVMLLLVVFVTSLLAYGQQSWYFGEGLREGDEFSYRICDYDQSEILSQCYFVNLAFLQLLPSHYGKVWIVSAHINQGGDPFNAIFQIEQGSFEIRTDGVSAKYADSIQRTVGWIKPMAHIFSPQSLKVGSSWGQVSSGSKMTELVITKMIQEDTFEVGYLFFQQSYFLIKDGFPFPIKAELYKPAYQSTPLQFTLELQHFSHNDSCHVPEMFVDASDNLAAVNKTEPAIFDAISSEKEIRDIIHSDSNGTKPANYEKIGKFLGNFTDILRSITDMTKEIIQNQTKSQ